MLNTNVATLALSLYRKAAAEAAAYDAEVAEWYTNGDGARKRLSFPYCRHGVTRWSPYDCACGACESDGGEFVPLRERESALREAKWRMSQVEQRRAAVAKVLDLPGVPDDLMGDLVVWSWEPARTR